MEQKTDFYTFADRLQKKQMKEYFQTKPLCRAAVVAALYAILTWAFGNVAYMPLGLIEIRPSEALTVLPLFFPETAVGLYIGCMLANLLSSASVFDVLLGSLATLIAGVLTALVGKIVRSHFGKVALGGSFPVLINALLIPLVIFLYLGSVNGAAEFSYGALFLEILLSEAIWVYGLGSLLYFTVLRLQKKGVSVLQPVQKK